ncbi:hypothetical protein BC831DRAFT_38046 [Entophlyctis helioformis]|nr:hypothetical protein BC831DRAFT_38046 [Entophlyctis helioformis]
MNGECLVCLATPVAAQWIASKMPSHQVQCGQTRLPALASSSPISSGSVSSSVLLVECAATAEFGVQVGMPIQLSSKQFLQPTPRIDPLSTSQWLLIVAAASHVAVGKHQAARPCDANALAVLLNNNQIALFTAVLPTSLAVWSHQTCTQSVPRPRRHGRQTAVPSSSMGNGACLDRQRVNAPACLSAACLLSAPLLCTPLRRPRPRCSAGCLLDGLLHATLSSEPRSLPRRTRPASECCPISVLSPALLSSLSFGSLLLVCSWAASAAASGSGMARCCCARIAQCQHLARAL